jgi:hypothetical protein
VPIAAAYFLSTPLEIDPSESKTLTKLYEILPLHAPAMISVS